MWVEKLAKNSMSLLGDIYSQMSKYTNQCTVNRRDPLSFFKEIGCNLIPNGGALDIQRCPLVQKLDFTTKNLTKF